MKTTDLIETKPGRARRGRERRGFTLTELLVVVAVLAILGFLSVSATSNTKSASQTLQCFQNAGQMTRAWTMYALDNRNWLAANSDDGGYGSWLGGTMTSPGSYNDPTNYGLLNNTYSPGAHGGPNGVGPSAIGNYLKNYKFAKCPADPGRFDGSGADPTGARTNGSWGLRVRNYAMNAAVGTQGGGSVTGPWLTGSYAANQPGKPFNTYGKLSSWGNPGPANTFVITHEDPWSINDGTLGVSCALPDQWVDWPASLHDKGTVFSFADGHVIVKHWVDPRTYAIWYNHNNAPSNQPNNPDLDWLRLHTSAEGDGSPMPVSTIPSP